MDGKRINGGKPILMHKRTVEGEIAGHEFFSPDGKKIWFDLQMPRSVTFLHEAEPILVTGN